MQVESERGQLSFDSSRSTNQKKDNLALLYNIIAGAMQSYNYLFQNHFYSHFSCHRGKTFRPDILRFLFYFAEIKMILKSSQLFWILEKITQIS